MNATEEVKSTSEISEESAISDEKKVDSKPKFTQAQLDAMNARGRSLLVSAAAGSGKTFTLTKRIIDSIISDENKTIGRMLIVTFTRSAAAELKKKISDALSAAITEHPDNTHLQDELLKLGSAHISTIDSFFSSPVKANFEKLGLPASMRLADEAELESLRHSVFKETLAEFFENYSGIKKGELADVGHRSVYTDFLSLITGIRDTSGIIPTLLEYYNKTQTSPEGVAILKASAERLRKSADLDFFETREGEIIRNEVSKSLIGASVKLSLMHDEAINLEDEAISSSALTALKIKVAPVLDSDRATCDNLFADITINYSHFYDSLSGVKFERYPSLKGDSVSTYSEIYKNSRSKILQPIKKLRENYFSYTQEEISRHFVASAEVCDLLYSLLSDFDRRYNAEKRSRGICEFSDMPKFVLQLLENSDGSLTPLAKSMAEQYDEVYIDEYQDVNAIQDRIFEIIGGDRRFMVGDIKQSIYCFRDAEPSIFASYREKFPTYDREKPNETPESGGSSIFMSENFRCDKGIVDFVNGVCDKIFFSFADSIGYKEENDNLKFGKIGAHFDPPMNVKINLVEPSDLDEDETETEADENQDKLYDEAVITANEIARLIRDKNEKNADGSPVRAGDIAVLVRGHKQIEPIAAALNAIGIKYVTNAKNELLSGDEMKLLADLLTVIDNPRDDLPLCHVLTGSLPVYSPILSLDEVIGIKESGKNHSLYDALVGFARNDSDEGGELKSRCLAFITALDKLRRLSSKVSAEKLLRACAASEFFSRLCESDSFTYLYSVAGRYSRGGWNGLYSFITYYKSLMEKGDSNSDPVKAQADEVTIITMHQSKGLEYKVCFLFGLGKNFNFNSLNKPLIFNRELGVSLKLPAEANEDGDVYSKTHIKREENILWKSAYVLSKNKMLEEEARVFYVALTRARERLYLSATLPKSYEEMRLQLGLESRDFMNEIRSSKSYIRWTLIALDYIGDPDSIFEVNTYQRGNIPPLADRITREEVESDAYGITDRDKHFAKSLLSPHGETEEEKLLSLIPAKVAASKVSPQMLDESVFIPTPTGDLFTENDEDKVEQSSDSASQIKHRIELMRSRKVDFESLLDTGKKPTAAEKGSAAHLILQFCDYSSVQNNGLDAEIERLIGEKFITQRTADIVNRRQLKGFFESNLFRIAQKANKVLREFQFGLFRPASDFTENAELKRAVADKNIFVQGSIDLILETDEGIILCDYKTDRITPEESADKKLLAENMVRKHKAQLDEYRFAVKQIFGAEPIKVCIYSIPLGEVIDID